MTVANINNPHPNLISSTELLERKEELEKRKKKLQNMKRVAKRGSSSGRGSSGSSSSATAGSSNLAMNAPDLPTASGIIISSYHHTPSSAITQYSYLNILISLP